MHEKILSNPKKVPQEGQLETLKRELKLAKNIQTTLLNANPPSFALGKVLGISIPARLIGGDYYDFHLLPDGRLRIVIGDVMGKGIPAAMLMILTRGAFRSAAAVTKGPGATLTAMNEAMFSDLRTLGSFVTVLCADWDPWSKVLTYANAGHHFPMSIHSEEVVQEFPKVRGVMIGGLPNQIYPEGKVQLNKDDYVVFYTDGIVEAQNLAGEMYRIERLRNVLKRNYGKDLEAIRQSILESIQMFTEDAAQKDDITMVLLKVSEKDAKET